MKIDISSDYVLEKGEIDNIVYLTFKYGAGWNMRVVDLVVCQHMAGSPLVGPMGVKKLLAVTVEYLWDHILGEPGNKSAADIAKHMVPIFEEWYRVTTPEERRNTA